MVVFGTRWKDTCSESFALANPISKIISELQFSLVQTKPCGLLLHRSVLLEVGLEQANLLDQACFGCRIVTSIKDKDQYLYELSLEEAFYLCVSLRCLEIVWENKFVKNNDELWELMKSKKGLFPILYVAYSHLRAKNWVVRPEIKYGVDFVAYRHHPSLVHSEYAVMVSAGNGDLNTRLTSWPSLHATVRLEDGVAKTLLVLHINNKNAYDSSTSYSCLERYTVNEQMIARWNPEQCNEDHALPNPNDKSSCELNHNAHSSPHYHFNKFSMHKKLSATSTSLQRISLNTRWKGKGSKAIAQQHPMSELINQLQSSQLQSKACGLLTGFGILLEVVIEQADLLNRTCIGCPIITTYEDTHWFELSLEEGFYLYHSLTCLQIVSKNQSVKDSGKIWELMTSKKKLFPLSYKAYHHLRAKNWVVRSGIQYGVDFVAYCHHPSLVHSEYAVIVVDTDDNKNGRLLVWPDLHATVRLEGGVAKTLLVLHIKKNGYTEVSISCLKHYTVEEQIVTRWNPERCRENKKLVQAV